MPQPPGGGNPSPVDLKVLENIVAERPDATSHEITASYNRRVARGSRVHRSSIVRALERCGFVFKKNGIVRRSRTVRFFEEEQVAVQSFCYAL
jgi:transposase